VSTLEHKSETNLMGTLLVIFRGFCSVIVSARHARRSETDEHAWLVSIPTYKPS